MSSRRLEIGIGCSSSGMFLLSTADDRAKKMARMAIYGGQEKYILVAKKQGTC